MIVEMPVYLYHILHLYFSVLDGSIRSEYEVRWFCDHSHLLLHASMVVHLYDLYCEFHSHSCGPYLYRQLWSVPKVAPWSLLLSL